MSTLVLFLRAVNLGAHNKVPMKRLMELLAASGAGSPSYLLQSGNIIISNAAAPKAELLRLTERLILEEFGVETVAVGRTPAELAVVVQRNPYVVPQGGSVHVAFWDEPVEAELLAALAEEVFADAELSLANGQAYLRYESSSHASKLSNALLERRLKVPSTSRNVNTLHRLLALDEVAGELG